MKGLGQRVRKAMTSSSPQDLYIENSPKTFHCPEFNKGGKRRWRACFSESAIY